MAAQTFLFRTSTFYQDNNNPYWGREFHQPTQFHEDSLPIEQVQIIPAPNKTGNQVAIAAGQGLFGTIAGSVSAPDFDVALPASTDAFYGTISEAFGNPFVETQGPFFGVIAEAIPSTNNLSLFGAALPLEIIGIVGTDPVEVVPDSFIPYIKYGILAEIFNSNSELKDSDKAAYCAARYKEGISLSQAIILSVMRDQ